MNSATTNDIQMKTLAATGEDWTKGSLQQCIVSEFCPKNGKIKESVAHRPKSQPMLASAAPKSEKIIIPFQYGKLLFVTCARIS